MPRWRSTARCVSPRLPELARISIAASATAVRRVFRGVVGKLVRARSGGIKASEHQRLCDADLSSVAGALGVGQVELEIVPSMSLTPWPVGLAWDRARGSGAGVLSGEAPPRL